MLVVLKQNRVNGNYPVVLMLREQLDVSPNPHTLT